MSIRYIDESGNYVCVNTDNMSYSELIYLKDSVSGLPVYSVVDAIIRDKMGTCVSPEKGSCGAKNKKFKQHIKIRKHKRKW